MSLSSFFSSFLNVVHADAEEKEEEVIVESTPEEEVVIEQVAEEEEEPEDVSVNCTTCFVSMLIILLDRCTR